MTKCLWTTGFAINDLGMGPEEIEKTKNVDASSQERKKILGKEFTEAVAGKKPF